MKLKEMRVMRGQTQKSVADYLCCSVTVYSRYESGQRAPTIETLTKLADFFQVTLDYLVGRETDVIESVTLYEANLLKAARLADDRARADALSMLESHRVEHPKKDLA